MINADLGLLAERKAYVSLEVADDYAVFYEHAIDVNACAPLRLDSLHVRLCSSVFVLEKANYCFLIFACKIVKFSAYESAKVFTNVAEVV